MKTRMMTNLQGTNDVVSKRPLTPDVLSATLICGLKCLKNFGVILSGLGFRAL